MKSLPKLSGTEHRLLDYMTDPSRSRFLPDVAKAIDSDRIYLSFLIQRLKKRGLVTVEHSQYNRLKVEVI